MKILESRWLWTLMHLCILSIVVTTLASSAEAADVCVIGNNTYADGDHFTLNYGAHCIRYSCRQGTTFPELLGCYRDADCWPINDTFTDGCLVRQCQSVAGIMEYKAIKEGCSAPEKCLAVGESLYGDCTNYTCLKEVEGPYVTYHLAITGVGCKHKGDCIPLNSTITEDCIEKRCEKHGYMVGLIFQKHGCKYNGKCLNLNETVTEKCRTYKCKEQKFGFSSFFHVQATNVLCEDGYGGCHQSGEYFPLLMDGKHPRNCTCKVDGFSINYTCEGSVPVPVG